MCEPGRNGPRTLRLGRVADVIVDKVNVCLTYGLWVGRVNVRLVVVIAITSTAALGRYVTREVSGWLTVIADPCDLTASVDVLGVWQPGHQVVSVLGAVCAGVVSVCGDVVVVWGVVRFSQRAATARLFVGGSTLNILVF